MHLFSRLHECLLSNIHIKTLCGAPDNMQAQKRKVRIFQYSMQGETFKPPISEAQKTEP